MDSVFRGRAGKHHTHSPIFSGPQSSGTKPPQDPGFWLSL